MTSKTLLLLFFALLFAVVVSYFQYFFKVKSHSKLSWLLAFLRFLAVFALLVLLINPLIKRNTYEIIKPPLPLVVDNSSSISDLTATQKSLSILDKIKSNSAINEKFNCQTFIFDKKVVKSDSIDFKGVESNFEEISKVLKDNFRNLNYPIVLLTDGNQTNGNDYVYSFDETKKVFPIVLGDTTSVTDLKVSQINVNQYAFLKNHFPVEVMVGYSGNSSLSSDVKIYQDANLIAQQKVNFNKFKNASILNFELTANKVGSQVYKVVVGSNIKEKNLDNNAKYFAIDVIDQKTKIYIVSDINHPDVGAFKKAIESNEQRTVTVVQPQTKSITDCDLLILYQPNRKFESFFKEPYSQYNTMIVTGTNTDYIFLNQVQNDFDFKMSSQTEDYSAQFETTFTVFDQDNIGFELLPPLQNLYGKIKAKTTQQNLINSTIRNISTNQPLISFVENIKQRKLYWFGENSWRWRLQSHIAKKSFKDYDGFIDKCIQYLATSSNKKSLVVNHQRFYNSTDEINIQAQYFNKNYELDDKARLTIELKNLVNNISQNFDFIKNHTGYSVTLNQLPPAKYSFTVKELNSGNSYSSRFEILNYNIEKQFVNSNYKKLNQLAVTTNGGLFYDNQVDRLIADLINDTTYKSIQKEKTTTSSLIDWYWLLIAICICLAIEWLVRKYHGLL